MDPADDQQVSGPVSIDVRLPPAVVTAFRAAGQAEGRRSSAQAEAMVQELLRDGPVKGHVPVQSVEDRRLTLRLEAATHAQLAREAASLGVPVRALVRLAVERGLQRRGQL